MKCQISSGVVVLSLAAAGLALVIQNAKVRCEEPKKTGTGTVRDTGSGNDATRPPQPPLAKGGSGPEYNEKGELKRPVGYETWVFVGSNLGIEYGDGAAKDKPAEKKTSEKKRPDKGANFHNVYINPEAYARYIETGTFPEKTVFVLDIFKAEEREPRKVVAEGLFPGAHSGTAVAVKNSARPDGSKTDWAYYDFGLEAKTAKAFADKACYDCHLEHADDDNVWVQFYPTLRGRKKL